MAVVHGLACFCVRAAQLPDAPPCSPCCPPCTPLSQALLLGSGRRLPFDKLCICAGARPKQLPPVVFRSASGAEAAQGEELAALQRRVLTIRDTDSVQRLGRQLRHAARVAVVGNGGIALELM